MIPESNNASEATVYRNYQGGYFRTLISPAQSGGRLAVLDMVLPKGSEPPPHLHEKEDESFYVLDGEVSFFVNNTEFRRRSGESLFAPRMVHHCFKIITVSARMLTILTPGDFWNYFVEFSEPCYTTPKLMNPVPPAQEQLTRLIETLSYKYAVTVLNGL